MAPLYLIVDYLNSGVNKFHQITHTLTKKTQNYTFKELYHKTTYLVFEIYHKTTDLTGMSITKPMDFTKLKFVVL
jgi:hypothetical protein